MKEPEGSFFIIVISLFFKRVCYTVKVLMKGLLYESI